METRGNLERHLTSLLQREGCSLLSPEGLVTSAFPDTFAPSAFHKAVVASVSRPPRPETPPHAYVGTDWAFRHVDLEKVGESSVHLSSFRMLVFYSVRAGSPATSIPTWRQEVICRFVDLLESVGVSPKNLIISYFGGGTVLEEPLPPDDKIVSAWVQSGVLPARIFPINGSANYTNVVRRGQPAGPRCEVYFDPGQGRRPFEVGTVVFESGIVSGETTLRIMPSPAVVMGAAIGLERLVMAACGCSNVFTVPELARPLGLLVDRLHPSLASVSLPQMYGLLDGLRSLLLLSQYELENIRKEQRERIRKLQRNVRRHAASLGLVEPEALFSSIADAIVEAECVTLRGSNVALAQLLSGSFPGNQNSLAQEHTAAAT